MLSEKSNMAIARAGAIAAGVLDALISMEGELDLPSQVVARMRDAVDQWDAAVAAMGERK